MISCKTLSEIESCGVDLLLKVGTCTIKWNSTSGSKRKELLLETGCTKISRDIMLWVLCTYLFILALFVSPEVFRAGWDCQ